MLNNNIYKRVQYRLSSKILKILQIKLSLSKLIESNCKINYLKIL